MCKKPAISIIIPVYNAKKYIKKCLNSVIKQNYKNFEIICINDASTDGSLNILKEYANKDKRIKLIENSCNKGAGISRNIGIDNCIGDYVLFLDADDWIQRNCLEILVRIIESNKSIDFINLGLILYNSLGNIQIEKILFPFEYLNKIISPSTTPDTINFIDFKITKLINREFLKTNNIKFNSNCALEDLEYTLQLLLYAKQIFFINDVIYNYRTSVKNSVSSKIPNYTYYYMDYINFIKRNFGNNVIVQKNLLIIMYKQYIQDLLKSFFCKVITFDELKILVKNNIDIELLKDIPNKYYINVYNDILNYEERFFNKKYFYKFWIKNNVPAIYIMYKKVKNIYKLC